MIYREWNEVAHEHVPLVSLPKNVPECGWYGEFYWCYHHLTCLKCKKTIKNWVYQQMCPLYVDNPSLTSENLALTSSAL